MFGELHGWSLNFDAMCNVVRELFNLFYAVPELSLHLQFRFETYMKMFNVVFPLIQVSGIC